MVDIKILQCILSVSNCMRITELDPPLWAVYGEIYGQVLGWRIITNVMSLWLDLKYSGCESKGVTHNPLW